MAYHLAAASGVHQRRFRLFELDAILVVFEDKQGVAFVHILMLGEADALDITRHADVDGRQILLDLCVVGRFASFVVDEEACHLPQPPRTRQMPITVAVFRAVEIFWGDCF